MASHFSQVTAATVNWKTCEDGLKTVREEKKGHRLWIRRAVGEGRSRDVSIRHFDRDGNAVGAAEQLTIVICAAIGTDSAHHLINGSGECWKRGRAKNKGDCSCIPGTHGHSPPFAASHSAARQQAANTHGDRIISLELTNQSRTESRSSSQRLLPAHVKAIAARSGGAVRLACLDRNERSAEGNAPR